MSLTFKPGDAVRIRADDHPGHHRTPLYLKGSTGVIDHFISEDRNPETLAYGQDGKPLVPVYQVRFMQKDLWPDYGGPATDVLMSDMLETWLEPVEP